MAEAAIKLLGIYFAFSAVLIVVSIIASLVLPPVEGAPSAAAMAAYTGVLALGRLAVAAACLIAAEPIARKVFPEHAVEMPVSRRDLLMVGVALLGVATAGAGVPGIIQVAAKAIWYAERSRQAVFWPAMQQSWQMLTDGILALIVGGVMAAFAPAIAAILTRHGGAERAR